MPKSRRTSYSLPGGHRDQLVRRPLPLDIAPASQQRIDRPLQLARQQDRPRLHPLEISLREVVRQPRDVIHVAVRDADDVAGQGEVGSAADVEADVQLRDLHDRLLAGDAVADDVESTRAGFGEFLDEERFFGNDDFFRHKSVTLTNCKGFQKPSSGLIASRVRDTFGGFDPMWHGRPAHVLPVLRQFLAYRANLAIAKHPFAPRQTCFAKIGGDIGLKVAEYGDLHGRMPVPRWPPNVSRTPCIPAKADQLAKN